MTTRIFFPVKQLRIIGFTLMMTIGLGLSGGGGVGAAEKADHKPLNAASHKWEPWSDDLFKRASRENKLVILDLEAVWCHWCHVMEEETYGDKEISVLLKKHFLTVQVDQDANPDLSNRYGDWGWPATIIFSPSGQELAKLRGYIPPLRMASLIKAFIKDPTPGPSVIAEPLVRSSKSIYLSAAQREHLISNYMAVYDAKNGGWGRGQKFIHSDSMDYALADALSGDRDAVSKARVTLDAALNLLDREWGGVYQYSDPGSWKSPHYEKIMSFQSQYLRQYSFAYTLWKDDKYRDAADNIYRYLIERLRAPGGGFFTSQDADASRSLSGADFYRLTGGAREKLGVMPRIDKNIYARENGWAISGLVAYSNAVGDGLALGHARASANWILKNRALGSGGFSHGANDRGGPYLGDSLAMGQAALDLYGATGVRKWLDVSVDAGRFILAKFKHKEAGFWSYAKNESDAFDDPIRQIEENIQLARFANLLYRVTGDGKFKALAGHAMRYLVSPDITAQRRFLIGVVIADRELSAEPAHITIVGHKDDPRALALHRAARFYPALYKRVDWWDKREGPLANPDVRYPSMEQAAAFACANKICSLPAFEPAELATRVDRMLKIRTFRQESSN